MKNGEVRRDCVKTGPYVGREAGTRTPSREGPRAGTKHKSHQRAGEASCQQTRLAALLLKTALAEENEGNKQNGQ